MKPTIIYPVDYRVGYEWWTGKLKEDPLPGFIYYTAPVIIFIYNINRRQIFSGLGIASEFMSRGNCKGFMWRSSCDVVLKWSQGEAEAQSIYSDESGMRWIGPPNSASRFCKLARMVSLRRNYGCPA
jgi:hypothetical protein